MLNKNGTYRSPKQIADAMGHDLETHLKSYSRFNTKDLENSFDQDPENPLIFVWSEAYKNDEAFIAHLANPAIGEYLQEHPKLADDFTVEVYGTVGDKCLEVMKGTGVPFKVFQSKLGYSRL